MASRTPRHAPGRRGDRDEIADHPHPRPFRPPPRAPREHDAHGDSHRRVLRRRTWHSGRCHPAVQPDPGMRVRPAIHRDEFAGLRRYER